jgi:serine phosphatase RsbU (regulator of sigma subunit)
MLLADVSGHGKSASETATRLRELMRQNINRINQSHLVARMNDHFNQVAERNGAFATAVVSTFFAPTRMLTLCLAGHPYPLVYRKKMGAWSVLNVSYPRTPQLADLPLGVTGNVQYSEHNVRLEKGDCILLYTDGLTEAANRSGQQLGTKQLCGIADQLDPAQPGQFLSALWRQIERDAGYRFDSDDMTALLVEATDSKVSLRNNLLAPIRFLGSLFGLPGRETK